MTDDKTTRPEGPQPSDETVEQTGTAAGDTLALSPQPSTAEDSTSAYDADGPADAVTTTYVPAAAPAYAPAGALQTPGGLVTVRTGPRPGAIVLGLLCLLASGFTVLEQTTALDLDVRMAGPASIATLGVLLLLVGLVGMAGRRR